MTTNLFNLKFCWICGSIENDSHCTNKTCPRYEEIVKSTDNSNVKSSTTNTAEK
jgi:hypothetical protein